jgi:ABC-type sugar transport system substrate-binding protein
VQVLVAQDLWGWGAQSVNILTDKIVHNKTPEKFVYGELTRVSKDNVEEYAKKWETWAPAK